MYPSSLCPTLVFLPPQETWTGYPELGQTTRLAVGAASILVFPHFELNVVGALAACLKGAALLVQLVRFVMAAFQADQPLEAHFERERNVRIAS